MFRLAICTLLCTAPLLASGCATTRTTGEQIDDSMITRRVENNFATHTGVSAMKVDVDTLNGVVTLRGETDDPKERERAETVARSTPGVKGVINKIEISSEGDLFDGNPDTWITTKVKAALAADSTTKAVDIDVDTDDRVVTLSGIVESEAAKRQAVQVAEGIEGVRKVVDEMKLEGAEKKRDRDMDMDHDKDGDKGMDVDVDVDVDE